MDRSSLLDRLDKATELAAKIAVQRRSIDLPKKMVPVGTVYVQLGKNNLYNILNYKHEIIFKDISVFDVAVIIAQRFSAGENSAIKKILFLESCFSKQHTDMVHYLSCMKHAKTKKDTERLCILEDKFQTAEMRARMLRDRISSFKRAK